MKIFLRSYEKIGEEDKITEKACADLAEAKSTIKANEKIHLCYHDEANMRPCRLIDQNEALKY